MADYFSPTVIQPAIPLVDMTPLECLVLSLIFDSEPSGNGLYLFSHFGPSDSIGLPIAELREACEASEGADSRTTAHVAACLAAAPADDTDIDVDFGGPAISWEDILQDIVRRSSTLTFVTAVMAFTCSKMRPDGFGGMAMLVTADSIRSKSTEDTLCEFMDEAEHGPLRAAPGFGVHPMLSLAEADVRAQIADHLSEDDEALREGAEAVTDLDIRIACQRVVERTDLTEERGSAVFRAALAAIDEAKRRSGGGS